MIRNFHVWKFDPSFSNEGTSYRRLEACVGFTEVVLADVEPEAVPSCGPALDADVGVDMVL